MAGRGITRKPADVAADKRNGTAAIAAAAELAISIPKPPTGLLASTRAEWDEFWVSPVAHLLQVSDLAAVRRLFQLRDELERCYREVRTTKKTTIPAKHDREGNVVAEAEEISHSGRIGLGSTGHFTVSPEAKLVATLAAECRQIEDRLGLNTRSRAGLMSLALPPTPPAEGEPSDTEGPPADADRDVIDAL